jgi:hypothetical protein
LLQKFVKTSIINNYAHDTFQTEYVPTIYNQFRCEVENNHPDYAESFPKLVLAIHDFSGRDSNKSLRLPIYQKADIIILCYSLANVSSLNNLETKWIKGELGNYGPKKKQVFYGGDSDSHGSDNDNTMDKKAGWADSSREVKQDEEDEDDSDFEGGWDSDSSGGKKKRKDSSDNSSPKNKRKFSDSDSPKRKNSSDSDKKPKKKDSSDDESPKNNKRKDSSDDSNKKNTRKNSSDSDKKQKKDSSSDEKKKE